MAYLRSALEAAAWAPSPLNSQPWEFIVIANQESKEKIFSEGERCRVCLGKADGEPRPVPRKDVREKATYIR